MDIHELMKKINEGMENFDLVSSRKFIEENMELINENRHLLRSNARSLFEILKDNTNSVKNPLNRKELNVINSINAYATKFDVRGLKMSVKSNADFLIRKDIKHYLNEDAKTLLISMNALFLDE